MGDVVSTSTSARTAGSMPLVAAAVDPSALGLLLDGILDHAIFLLDADGRVASWNAGAERVVGYAREEVLGRPYAAFYPSEDRAAGEPERVLDNAARSGRFEREGWCLRRDGSRFWACTSVHAVGGDAAPAGFAVLARDKTERIAAQAELDNARAAQAQVQRMEALGRLTGGVAHDFNNLLTVVMSCLDQIETAPDDAMRNPRLIDTAQRAAQRGAMLVRQLLAFSRNQPLAPQVHEVNALLRGCEPALRRVVGDPVTLNFAPAQTVGCVNVDAEQFEAALTHLVANASDAMPGGGSIDVLAVRVDVTAAANQPFNLAPGAYAAISVRDDGVGMAPDVADRACEPFFTTKDVGRGTGLGLSQVYGFAAQSRGAVHIASEVGRGTTVTICLPLEESLGITREEPAAVPGRHMGTVLLVEDDENVRRSTADALRELGYTVLTASDGPRALAVLRNERDVEVLFSDVVMPGGMSGVDLAHAARRVLPDLRVLLASGHLRNTPTRDGWATEFPFLAKPYRLVELSNRLQNLLRRH